MPGHLAVTRIGSRVSLVKVRPAADLDRRPGQCLQAEAVAVRAGQGRLEEVNHFRPCCCYYYYYYYYYY